MNTNAFLGRLYKAGVLTTAMVVVMPHTADASIFKKAGHIVHNTVKAIGNATPKVNIGSVHIDPAKATSQVVNATVDKTIAEGKRTVKHAKTYAKEPGRLVVDTLTAPVTLSAQGIKDLHDTAQKNGSIGQAIAQATEPASQAATVVSVNDQHLDTYLHDHRGTVNTLAAVTGIGILSGGGVSPFVIPDVSRDKHDHWRFGASAGFNFGVANYSLSYHRGMFSTSTGVGIPKNPYVNVGLSEDNHNRVTFSAGTPYQPFNFYVSTDNKLHTDKEHLDYGFGVDYGAGNLQYGKDGTFTASYTITEDTFTPKQNSASSSWQAELNPSDYSLMPDATLGWDNQRSPASDYDSSTLDTLDSLCKNYSRVDPMGNITKNHLLDMPDYACIPFNAADEASSYSPGSPERNFRLISGTLGGYSELLVGAYCTLPWIDRCITGAAIAPAEFKPETCAAGLGVCLVGSKVIGRTVDQSVFWTLESSYIMSKYKFPPLTPKL